MVDERVDGEGAYEMGGLAAAQLITPRGEEPKMARHRPCA